MNTTDLRLECLRLAVRDGEPHEIVVKAAEAYMAFVMNADTAAVQEEPIAEELN